MTEYDEDFPLDVDNKLKNRVIVAIALFCVTPMILYIFLSWG